ncbi:MAG: lipoyl synthase [Ilumatobacteraceae bacterium]|nr:lipoyl synthase [Ilumatobacteraceae bacterium]
MSSSVLRVRWLGRVAYSEALALQESIFHNGSDNRLLLLEHHHVFTYGPSADLARNLKCDPAHVGAEFVAVNRGGDITYHGPGQLVGYPLLTLPPKLTDSEGPADSVAYVHSVEQMIIDSLRELGLQDVGTMSKYPGVWVNPNGDNPRKICAIGVRVSRRRTMHGFALNVSTDLEYMREHIVPCGISEYPVTSMHEEGLDVSIKEVVDVVSRHAAKLWGNSQLERQDVAWKESVLDLSAFSRGEGPGQPVRMMGRLARAGVEGGVDISARKPDWIRPRVHHGPEVLALKKTLRDASLVTVCEEAGCPNLSECWSSGTATFMVLGERCTRACGFCLIDTQKPLDVDHHEPKRVADAVRKMGLSYAVLTMVARDDLVDGGMEHVAQCVRAIRAHDASISVETLISDVRGTDALQILIDERPDVLNHNVETVPRLQRAVRPSAGYARSLSVLARSKRAGLVTKSGLIVGMGETDDEVVGTLADLAAVGVDIVTIGQYLRPTTHHLPVARWVEPHVFEMYKEVGEVFGIGHVESSPLTRSSYHAKESAQHAVGAAVPVSIGVK